MTNQSQKQIIKGTLKNSRREANFISYYMRNKTEEYRHDYIKQNIVGKHADLLVPFIHINKHDRYHRKNHYMIDLKDGVTPPHKGILHQSRRNADDLLSLPKNERFCNMKQFIAHCNTQLLKPFVRITGHDEKYREIQYEIEMPSRTP